MKLLSTAFIGAISILGLISCEKETIHTPKEELIKKNPSFLILNEGQYGTSSGSINSYNPETQTLTTHAIENKGFGNTSCHMTRYNNKLYVVSKEDIIYKNSDGAKDTTGYRLSVYDEITGKFIKGTSHKLPAEQGRSFTALDSKKGVLALSKSMRMVDLETLTIEDALQTPVAQEFGDTYVKNGYMFVVGRASGLLAYKINDMTAAPIQVNSKVIGGFAEDKGGILWAFTADSLIGIDTKTLSYERVWMPNKMSYPFAWRKGAITYSAKHNSLYVAAGGSFANNKIYKYLMNFGVTLLKPIYEVPEEFSIYGQGLFYNPVTEELYLTVTDSGYGASYSKNHIITLDPITGEFKGKFQYKEDAFWFPGMMMMGK